MHKKAKVAPVFDKKCIKVAPVFDKKCIKVAPVFDTMLEMECIFAKEGGLELDFVVQLSSVASIIEVKARTGNAKAAKTVLAHPDYYGKANLIKIGDYNVGYENGILTIPYYLTFLLNRIN